MVHMRQMNPRDRARTSAFVRGNKDPTKMTYAEMVLVKRGLGAKRAHANSQSARVEDGALIPSDGNAMVRVMIVRI